MTEANKIFTRLGDGSGIWMTPEEILADIEAGVADAVDRGKIEPLTRSEKQKIYRATGRLAWTCSAGGWKMTTSAVS